MTKNRRQRQYALAQKTEAERVELWQRREKAAELWVLGRPFTEIAATLGVAPVTAWRDVRLYFREAAQFYRAPEFRAQLTVSLRWVVNKAANEYRRLGKSPELAEVRLKALDRVLAAVESLGKAHGLIGANTFHLELPGSPADVGAAKDKAPEWAAGLPPERVRAIRAQMLRFYDELPRAAVPEHLLARQAEVVDEPLAPMPPPSDPEVPPGPSTLIGS